MEQQVRFKLYESRSFSDSLNYAFNFISQQAKPFFRMHLRLSLPLLLVLSLVYYLLFRQFFTELELAPGDGFIGSSSYIGANLLSALINAIALLWASLLTLVYLRIYQSGKTPEVQEVYREALPHLGPILVLSLLTFITVFMGALILVLPGLYLLGRLALAMPALVMEKQQAWDAFQRSFEVTKGHFWGTFAMLIVASIIGRLLAIMVSLPGIIVFGIATFFSIEEGASPASALSGWEMGLMTTLSIVGGAVGTIFTILPLTFYYGAKVEDLEARSLMEDIENQDPNAQPSA